MTDFFTAVLARTVDRRPELTRRPMSAFETPRRLTADLLWTDGLDGGLEEETTVRPAAPPPVPAPLPSLAAPDDQPPVPEPSRRAQPRRSRPHREEEAEIDVRPERTTPGIAAPPRRTPPAPRRTTQATDTPPVERRTAVRRGLETIVETPAVPERVRQPAPQVEPPPATAPVAAVRAEPVTTRRVEEVPVVAPPRRVTPVAHPEETRFSREPPVRPRRRQHTPANPVVPPSPPPSPAVHVTIGRIEVKAAPARTAPPQPAPRPAAPKLSLDEYLRSRNGRAS